MTGLIFYLACLVFGWSLSRWLPIRFYRAEQAAFAIVTGLLAGSWLLFIGFWLLGYQVSFLLSIFILGVGGKLLWGQEKPSEELTKAAWSLWLLATLATAAVLGWLFLTNTLKPGEAGWYSAGASWGDLALHMSLISHLVSSNTFDFSFPLFQGAKLTYPFLIELPSVVLLKSGWSWQWSLLIPTFFLTASFIQLFLFLGLRLFGKMKVAVLALTLFLLNGSFAGMGYFWSDFRNSGLTLWKFMFQLPQDYSNLADKHLQLTNVVTTILLPQRGFLFGFSLFGAVVSLLFLAWKKDSASTILPIAAVMIGLTPFAHTHTFFVLLGFLLVLTLIQVYQAQSFKNAWTRALGLSIFLSLPQLIWQFGTNFHSGFSYFQFGWVKGVDQGILDFWLRNLGPAFILLIVSLFFIKKWLKEQPFFSYFYLTLIGLFGLSNLVIFQPFPYDNYKFLIYFYLVFCLAVAYLLIALASSRKGLWLAGILIISMTGTGFLSLLRESQLSSLFLSQEDIAFAEAVKGLVPVSSLILTADNHNHPVPTLTGRKVVMGYRGWLWSYGLDYQQTEQDIQAIFSGSATAEKLLDRYKITYVVIGPSEKQEWGANLDFFARRYPQVLEYGPWQVFKVELFK